nr:hypothetical protein [Chromobacterium sp. Panama]
MYFKSQIVDVHFIDDAAHAAMQLSAAGVGVVAVGNANDVDPPILQQPYCNLLVNSIPCQSVQSFNDQYIEQPGFCGFHHRCGTGAFRDAGHAGDAFILEYLAYGHIFQRGALPGHANLVVDRRFALLI